MNKRAELGLRITNALSVAFDYTWDANAMEAYQWIIDQMARELLGSEAAYNAWVKSYQRDGNVWHTGVGPEE